MSANPSHIPARAVAGDQLIAGTADGAGHIEHHNRIVGGSSPVTTTGTITTATSTVTSGDVGQYNNMTVVVSGTYAGVNMIFEVSPDAGNTWVPLVMSRLDGTGTESVSGVLTANATRGWEGTLPAVNRFRVRATAWTSGTANIILAAGSMPLEPVVQAIASNPPGSQTFSLTPAAAGISLATTTEALMTLVPQRNQTAAGTATTHTVTAGKTLRLFLFTAAFKGVAATSTTANLYLRAVNTGTVAATSPIVAHIA